RPTGKGAGPVGVDTIVQDSIKLVRGHLDKSKVEADVHIAPDLPTINGDPQHLKQVLINLFFNAVDAMPSGGKLSVAAGTSLGAGQIVISIADTGTGIDPEAMPHIFRPFFTTKKKRGTGLGLSVCDRIMRAHGGTINVDSSRGNGTTFFLRFPFMEDQRHDGLSLKDSCRRRRKECSRALRKNSG